MKKIFILGAVLISSILLFAQQTEGNDKALQIGASYTGDNVAVLAGGLKRGYNYLGLAHLNLTFDTERARLWKGGTFFLNASNTHGGTPSEDLIGDFQIASNIEAGEHTYLQELWYKQGFDRFEITAGLQDLNVEISVVDNGSVFINSSFGILPVISTNLHAPIFPLTSLGLTTRWDITENISWLNAIYDGSPIDFDNNPYNLSWQLNRGDGFLFVTEFQNKVSLFHRHAHYKLGAFSHNHYLEKVIHPDLADSLVHTVSGAYLIYEQNIL